MSERRVLKYRIPRLDSLVPMPAGARILAVAWQQGHPTIWAECDDAPLVDRQFTLVATGERFTPQLDGDNRSTYIGSVISDSLVFHVYEVMPD